MRRTSAVLSLFALVLAAGAGPAQGAARDKRPPLRAALPVCSAGAESDERFAVFTGSMPAYRGTRRMLMRFDLYVRPLGGRRWTAVRGRGLRRWTRSDSGRAGFVYAKRVENLVPGNEYRTVVRFRWRQTGRRTIRRSRRTPLCRQPELRPNLRIEALSVLPGPDASTRRYVVTVRNRGRSAAGAFDVGIVTTRDDVLPVSGIPARERTTVEVVAPACAAGGRVFARADVRGVVEESNERDNRSSAACDGR